MRTLHTASIRALALLLTVAPMLSACGGDSTSPGRATLTGRWNAEHVTAFGTDFIATGMAMSVTLAEGGTYILDITNDQVGFCEPGPDCQPTGTYSHTDTQITFNPDEESEITFTYTITGSTMSFKGTIGQVPVSLTFRKE